MPVRKHRGALYTSKRGDWATPATTCAAILRAFRSIALDPCAARHSKVKAARRYFTGGLERPWPLRGLVYVNPPYGKPMPQWVARCVEHVRAGGEVLLLVPARTDTAWWARITDCPGVAVGFIRGRLRFELPGVVPESAPFPCALIYYGPRRAQFLQLAKAARARVWLPASATHGTSTRAVQRAA